MNHQVGFEGLNCMQMKDESAIMASNPLAVLPELWYNVAGCNDLKNNMTAVNTAAALEENEDQSVSLIS